MKVWLTPQDSDDPPEEVKVSAELRRGIEYNKHGRTWLYYGTEGEAWHRDREAAVAAAREFRRRRIAMAEAELARLLALEPVV